MGPGVGGVFGFFSCAAAGVDKAIASAQQQVRMAAVGCFRPFVSLVVISGSSLAVGDDAHWILFISSFRRLLRDPSFDLLIQNVKRKRAVADDFVMKRAQIELCAQFLPCLVPQFEDFQLAQLVSQGLSRP